MRHGGNESQVASIPVRHARSMSGRRIGRGADTPEYASAPDYLFRDPITGQLIGGPSNSPEQVVTFSAHIPGSVSD